MFKGSQVRFATMWTILSAIAAAVALTGLVVALRDVLTWIVVAVFLAVALTPIVELLARVIPRGAAVAVVVSGAVGLIAGVALLMVPPFTKQLGELLSNAPELLSRAQKSPEVARLDKHLRLFGGISRGLRALPGYAGGLAGSMVGMVGQVAHGLVGVVSVCFVTVFLLLDGPALARRSVLFVRPSQRARVERIGAAIYRATSRYALGSMGIAGVAASFSIALLKLAGVPWFLPLGLGVGLMGLVPFVGATVGGIMVVLVAWGSVGAMKAAAVLGIFIVYQQLENHLLQPLVHRRTVKLSALAIALALLAGAELAGILGAILAIPVAGAVQIVLSEALAAWREPATVTELAEVAPPSLGDEARAH